MAKVKRGTTICKLEDLNYEVEVIDNPFKCNDEAAKWVMGKLNNEEFFIQACSKRYELVENKLIFPNVETILKQHGIEFNVQYSHTQNVRFYANYMITDKRYCYAMSGTSDTIQPMLRVQHSYNGLTKYKIIFGYFRVVCSNGLTIPVQEMEKYNLVIIGKHTTSILRSLKQLDSLLTIFSNEAIQITKAITDKYEMLGGRMVINLQDRVTEVLHQNKIGMIDNQNFNTVNNIVNRITTEMNDTKLGYNGKANDFLVYNGINQYLNDDSINIAAPEKRMEVDSKILEYLLENA
jgi:hypothetical protein